MTLIAENQSSLLAVLKKALHREASQVGFLAIEDVDRVFASAPAFAVEGPADYFDILVSRARQAANKASAKFPQPNYVTLKIAEEAGEVVRGAIHYAEGRMAWAEVEGEIVQLIAMLIRFISEGDEVNGVIPPKTCPICKLPFKPGDVLRPRPNAPGPCHSACLEKHPDIDCETGEVICETLSTFVYGEASAR